MTGLELTAPGLNATLFIRSGNLGVIGRSYHMRNAHAGIIQFRILVLVVDILLKLLKKLIVKCYIAEIHNAKEN